MALEPIGQKGYARIERNWEPGDRVALTFDMPVERVRAHPAVRTASGKAALQRGPVVYCVEEVDNPVVPLTRIGLPREADLRVEYREDLLGGVAVLEGEGAMIDDAGWEEDLYRTEPVSLVPCRITAVPYCAWDNRDPGQMRVWLREI